ncbi:MAG: hypothetical protein KAK04_12170 [Cyclobacteriaceae bacterium]|nr:hypothetical protein [Cyclobacteriaceae bacterium]
MDLISINYGDKDIDIVRKVVEIKKMDWDQVVADKQLMKDCGDLNFSYFQF